MTKPTFSFILPAYKKRFLAEAIDSIITQSYPDFELVVVDDDSPEGLAELVQGFNDSRIRYEKNQKNIGGEDLVANWNHCLQYAKNDFVILATDDDVMEPDYLADVVKCLEVHPNVDLVRTCVKKIDSEGNILEYELLPKEYLSCTEFAYFGSIGLIACVSNFVFRRDKLIDIGGFVNFPHAHYSDVATALAMSKQGVACVQAYHLNFRMSDINLSNTIKPNMAVSQMDATHMFMEWLERFLEQIEAETKDHFYTVHAFYGFRLQYLHMMGNLTRKLPLTQIFKVVHAIFCCHYAYKKEKIKLLADFLISRL